MRRFLASAWFPVCMSIVLAVAVTGAFAWLKPDGADVGNSEIVNIMKVAGWATGTVLAIISSLLIGILNLIRRIVRLRGVTFLHPVVVFIGIGVWFVFAWQLVMNEPRYTPIARGIIEFIGRPMFLGSFATLCLVVLLSLPLFIPSKKK